MAQAIDHQICADLPGSTVRLRCFEQAMMQCFSMTDPMNRLACFDGMTAVGIKTPSHVIPVEAQPQIGKPGAAQHAAPTPHQTPKSALGLRVSIGGGVGLGDHSGRFKVAKGDLNIHSFLGSAGTALTAQAWLDGLLGQDWTAGVQWLHFHNKGKISLNLPNLSIITDPVSAEAKTNVSADIGFLNIAYRPKTNRYLHPFIGVGMGGGYGEASFRYQYKAFGLSPPQVYQVKSPIGAVQAFLGLEFRPLVSMQSDLMGLLVAPTESSVKPITIGLL